VIFRTFHAHEDKPYINRTHLQEKVRIVGRKNKNMIKFFSIFFPYYATIMTIASNYMTMIPGTRAQVLGEECNQHYEIVSYMEGTFGYENCVEIDDGSLSSNEPYTISCNSNDAIDEVDDNLITTKYTAIYNDLDTLVPFELSVEYAYLQGGGRNDGIPFSLACTKDDLRNAKDLLDSISTPVEPLSPPSPPQDDDDCNQLTEMISLIEKSFGKENCEEFSAFPDALTVTCSIEEEEGGKYDAGTGIAKLSAPYNDVDIATPGDITIDYDYVDGATTSGTITFANDCTGDDLLNATDFVKGFWKDIEPLPQDDDCNQLTEIISLMEKSFGKENCEEFSAFPEALTVTCSIEEGTGTGTITAKLNAPYNEDDIATPGDITIGYGGGIVGIQPVVEFSNDCTGDDLRNARDLLKDIKLPPSQDDDDCNQLTEIILLMEKTFGKENCDEFSDFPEALAVTCSIEEGTGTGAITAKLNAPYNEDDIATPGDITLGSGGGIVGIQPVVEFSNDCTGDDLRNARDLLKDVKLTPKDTSCNEHSKVTALLEDTFGVDNCAVSVYSNNEEVWTCSSETTEGLDDLYDTSTVTVEYTASFDGDSLLPTTFSITYASIGEEEAISSKIDHDFVNDCTTTDMDAITELSGLKEECPGQYEIVTLLEDAFGDKKCESAESSTGFVWTCKRPIKHEHAFKGVVDEVWVATYESKFPDEDSVALPYDLKLDSLVVFEKGDLYNDEESDSYTIGTIKYVNDCTTTDVDETKELLKWVTTKEEVIIDDSNPWSNYFYCVWAHAFDREKCSWEDSIWWEN